VHYVESHITTFDRDAIQTFLLADEDESQSSDSSSVSLAAASNHSLPPSSRYTSTPALSVNLSSVESNTARVGPTASQVPVNPFESPPANVYQHDFHMIHCTDDPTGEPHRRTPENRLEMEKLIRYLEGCVLPSNPLTRTNFNDSWLGVYSGILNRLQLAQLLVW
jgi:hypothetical protein